jgi:DNA-binding protein H-NS
MAGDDMASGISKHWIGEAELRAFRRSRIRSTNRAGAQPVELAKRAVTISANCLICFRIATEYYLWGCKMNSSDFEGMPLDDLWSLHEQICLVLEKKIKDEKLKLEHRLDELVRKFDGTAAGIRQHRPRQRGEPKFRNPEDPSITWSGRGRHPRWVNELLAAGRAIDDFRIAETAS